MKNEGSHGVKVRGNGPAHEPKKILRTNADCTIGMRVRSRSLRQVGRVASKCSCQHYVFVVFDGCSDERKTPVMDLEVE